MMAEYYLLGLKAAHAHLFEDIAWSTDSVAEQTAQRAREIGLELVTLPSWYDVDDAASLYRLIDISAQPLPWPTRRPRPLPHPPTSACLQQIGLNPNPWTETTANAHHQA